MPRTRKTTDAGYGAAHKRARAAWQKVIDAGGGWCAETVCLRSSREILPGTTWHLAHTPDRSAYLGAAHPECNLSEAGRRGNPRTVGKRPLRPGPDRSWRTSRVW